MKYFLRKIFIVLSVVIVVFVSFVAICIYRVSPLLGSDSIFMPNKKQISNFLYNNSDELLYICEYIGDLEYDYVSWDSTDRNELKCWSEHNKDNFPVENDVTLFDNINHLEAAGVENIIKSNNYIEFSTWSSLDSSCSLVYSYNDEPDIQDLGEVILDKIDNGWYYYKHIGV